MTTDLALHEEARYLAQQLFGKKLEKGIDFADSLLDIYNRAQDKDFLLIHNPGGWGNTDLEHCLQWERSLVDGISTVVEGLGHTWLLIQYHRTGDGWWERVRDVKEQFRFFASKAKEMAARVEFLTRHIDALKIILIGVSQGAAFNNAVMQRLNGLRQVYSIELGAFSLRKSQRVVTERTLAIDGNGLMPDATIKWDIIDMLRAFSAAPFRWIKYQLQGKPVKFTYCVNVPGHDYAWSYPKVHQQIREFLEAKFGSKAEQHKT